MAKVNVLGPESVVMITTMSLRFDWVSAALHCAPSKRCVVLILASMHPGQYFGYFMSSHISSSSSKSVNMRVKDNKTTPGLSGTIPKEISVLSELEILDLRNNQINGQVPESIGSLLNLEQLLLANNEISGDVSPAICKLVNSGSLSQFTTDCGGSNPSVKCSCCTNCNEALTEDIDAATSPVQSDCLEGGTNCEDGQDCCSGHCMGDGTCM